MNQHLLPKILLFFLLYTVTIPNLLAQVKGIKSGDKAGSVIIPRGFPVSLRTTDIIDVNQVEVNAVVPMEVVMNVSFEQNVIFATGQTAEGRVVKKVPARSFGRPAYLSVEAKLVRAVDGSLMYVRGDLLICKGQHRRGLALGSTIAGGTLGLIIAVVNPVIGIPTVLLSGLIGNFIKGRSLVVEAGTQLTPVVSRDAIIYP